MIKYFITNQNNKIQEVDNVCEGCWIHLESPTTEEIETISLFAGVEDSIFKTVLDEDEIAQIVEEDGYRLIVMDIPKTINNELVSTRPLAMITAKNCFITVCTVPTHVLQDFFDNKIKNANTAKLAELSYRIMFNNSRRFLYYLKQIERKSSLLKNDLEKSQRNKELLQLLELQESLVYFSASLTANYSLVEKLYNHSSKTIDVEIDILEDTMRETKQAKEMCSIYREVIKNTMDAFAAVVNNNQNTIMKFLAAITIVLSIPMVIAGWWGMNTDVPWGGTISGFWLSVGISFLFSGIASFFMMKKRMF